MVDGLRGVNGVYVRKNVENRFVQELGHVQILNQKIMAVYVLVLGVKKNCVQKLFVLIRLLT